MSQAAVVVVGARDSGEKSVLGLAVGASETEAFWLEFCRSLARLPVHGRRCAGAGCRRRRGERLSLPLPAATPQTRRGIVTKMVRESDLFGTPRHHPRWLARPTANNTSRWQMVQPTGEGGGKTWIDWG